MNRTRRTPTARRQYQRFYEYQRPFIQPDDLAGQDEFVKPKKSLEIDATAIKEKLRNYESFEVRPGFEMNDLPKFDDLEPYGIAAAKELKLWELEVDRLVEVANGTRQNTLEDAENHFGNADRNGYSKLQQLALQLRYCLDIFIHDNELILIELEPGLANFKLYEVSHTTLVKEFDPDLVKLRYSKALRLKEYNDECVHALVDYLTGVMIRILLHTLDGDFWVENCVATIAKMAAKLKVLVFDLPRAVSICLEGTREVRSRMASSQKIYSLFEHEPRESPQAAGDTTATKQREVLWADSVDSGRRYLEVMDSFHFGVSALLMMVLEVLEQDENSGLDSDVFETSVTIFEAPQVDSSRMCGDRIRLCSERDGSIGVGGNPMEIRCAGYAANLCLETWERLARTVRSEPSAKTTTLAWKWTELEDDGQLDSKPKSNRLPLTKMAPVIEGLLPYLFLCGHTPAYLKAMSTIAFLRAGPDKPVRFFEELKFLGTFRVQTGAYLEKRPNFIRNTDVCSPSETRLAKNFALVDGRLLSGSRNVDMINTNTSEPSLRNGLIQTRDKYKTAMEKVQTWTIEAKAITIPYWRYPWGVLGGCAFLVTGGLLAGFTIGEKIPGVDPFNIAMFTWLLAGFLTILAKSIRVENWPWRDFIQGRVRCKTLTEVSAVTGIDSQTLLTILMRLERKMGLEKQGPFGAIWSRSADDGFSIDRPKETNTLMESGQLLIKVQSLDGPALVVLRAAWWEPYSSVRPKGRSEDEAGWVCRDFQDPGSWKKDDGKIVPLYTLCTNELVWVRVLGVFKEDAVFD